MHQSESEYYELLKDARKIIPYKLIKDNKNIYLDEILDYENTDLMKSIYFSINDDDDKCITLYALLSCTSFTLNVFNRIKEYNHIHRLTNEIPEWFIRKWEPKPKYYELLIDARKIIPYKLIKDNKNISLDDIARFEFLNYKDTDLMKNVYYSIDDDEDENHKYDKCKTLYALFGCTPYTSNVFNIIKEYNHIHKLTNEIPEWFIRKWKLE